MRQVILIVHNLRSAHNVGSLLRTADGLGVSKVYLTGYTPHPSRSGDKRLPHLAAKVDKQIAKTALGAEKTVDWRHEDNIEPMITKLKKNDFMVVALEQTSGSVMLPDYKPSDKIAIIVGREVEGIEPEVLALCNQAMEIPMLGQKESFNVAVTAAMALYHVRFMV
jgi:23S rRNA (guanosine2251-2'-O)-methyltransferase